MIPQRVWLGEDRFCFLNREHRVTQCGDWNRIEWGKLWLYNLHYFDMLRQPELSDEEGRRWICRWIKENPPFSGNGWEPYPLSLRIVNWIKWSLCGHVLSADIIDSLALQIRFLVTRLEKHLLANHYLANAKALVFAGMFFSGKEAEKWLSTGCDIYKDELPEQILADGGHFELSPMYHSIILEDLLDLYNIGAPLDLRDKITDMLHYLAVMSGPDGQISLMNDAAHGIALSPGQIFEYAGKLGFPEPDGRGNYYLENSGYCRIEKKHWCLICDGAAVGPDYQPGHAHADTLSFELWHDGRKILTDSGTGEYIDTDNRKLQRGTAGHNTVEIDGKNSSVVWGAHRVAGRAKIVERKFQDGVFEAEHNGYKGVRHRRKWSFASDGCVAITDTFSGRGKHRLKFFYHMMPDAKAEIQGDHVIFEADNKKFFIKVPAGGILKMQEGVYSPGFGVFLKHPVLCAVYDVVFPYTGDTQIGEFSE